MADQRGEGIVEHRPTGRGGGTDLLARSTPRRSRAARTDGSR